VHGCLLNSRLARRRHWQLRNEGIWNMEDTGRINDSHLLLLLWERRKRKQRKREIRDLLYILVI
jgi:hypothetical protein